MVFSEKCENASFLTAALPLAPALPQYSRNASIHCSGGTSLSFTNTWPWSSTSRPSATIELLMFMNSYRWILTRALDLPNLLRDVLAKQPAGLTRSSIILVQLTDPEGRSV